MSPGGTQGNFQGSQAHGVRFAPLARGAKGLDRRAPPVNARGTGLALCASCTRHVLGRRRRVVLAASRRRHGPRKVTERAARSSSARARMASRHTSAARFATVSFGGLFRSSERSMGGPKRTEIRWDSAAVKFQASSFRSSFDMPRTKTGTTWAKSAARATFPTPGWAGSSAYGSWVLFRVPSG